ncbi:hypothetical protein PMAYCL1PPCAC_27204, partial [Pristionchus mayeri]
MGLRTSHFGNILYILNFVHLIINFTFGWQVIPIVCLLFTLVITGYVFLGGIMDNPVIGSWPKQRIEIIYAIGLAALLLSVGLQTWIMFPAWLNVFFAARYLVACILHIGALFCMTMLWDSDKIYILILDLKHWWQIFALITLVFTMTVSKAVFI